MKEDRVTVRLDQGIRDELKELCLAHEVSFSTMVRILLKRSLNEIKRTVVPDTEKAS